MVRFDGYYIEEPIQIYDGRIKGNDLQKSSFYFIAYLFFKNGKVSYKSKHDFLNVLTDFKEEEFSGTYATTANYTISGSTIRLNKLHSTSTFLNLELISESIIFNKENKRKMIFVSWKELDLIKSKDFNDSLLNQKFGPFYHKKYQIYYQ